MNADGPDVWRTVEYRSDKRTMETVPLALLLGLAGLFFVVHVDPRPPSLGRLLFAFAVLAGVTGLVILSHILLDQMFEGRTPAIRGAAAGLIIVAIVVLVAIYWNSSGFPFRRARTRGPPLNIFGWLLIIGSFAWIAFALDRHFRSARPVLTLTPLGISFHYAWLKGLVIPWREIEGVGALEYTGTSGQPHRYPDVTAVLLSKAFYEENILPRRNLKVPAPSWDAAFVPKGEAMQVVLHHVYLRIAPKEVREPVEARWKAFRSGNTPALPGGGTMAGAPEVHGTWSVDGSPWQAIKFLVPLVGIAGVLLGAWLR